MGCITPPVLTDITTVLPTIDTILPAFQLPSSITPGALASIGGISLNSILPNIPTLPTLPMPYSLQMPNVDMPSVSATIAAMSVQSGQMMNVCDVMISTITQFVPAISLPGVPGLPGFDFTSMLSRNPWTMLDTISYPSFDIFTIPNMPPLFPTMDIPELKSIMALQFAGTGIMSPITGTITSLLDSFLSYLNDLEISGFPGIPALPTPPSLSSIMNMLPANPTIADLSRIPIGDFGNFSLPQPVYPTFDMPEIEMVAGLNLLQMSFHTEILTTLVNYATSLPILGDALHIPNLATYIGSVQAIPTICNSKIA